MNANIKRTQEEIDELRRYSKIAIQAEPTDSARKAGLAVLDLLEWLEGRPARLDSLIAQCRAAHEKYGQKVTTE